MKATPQSFALVTGASSGIGRHIALELAARGYGLAAVSNQPELLKELKEEVERANGVPVHTLNANLADPGAAQHVYNWCRSLGLRVDVLVNNAGILIFGEVTGVAPERASTLLQLHMHTPAMLCRLFGADMQARGSGHILNLSSTSAVMPYPVISLYGPSKTFLRAFSRALRTELRPHGVRVCCLMPGATATSLFDVHQVNTALAIRLRIMTHPDRVARRGVRALFAGRAECVPGFLNKLTVWFLPWLPHALIGLIYKVRMRRLGSD